ncbi:hypothetical protein [Tardiphaga sp.]|uniref:hypothetical protein n=1 Tax=Tardiphaga sp. TaxID=1926292 RepID=UPI002602BC3F|nr:hypothetical protein [Tardiphaga sp.]MDB5619683.1 hypothetical protein [Tardiphaga sp.]
MVLPGQYAVLTSLTLGMSMLGLSCAQAQWWTAKPADYEECAERAHRSASKDSSALLAACDGQFAGRRRPGGGYTYYDFMQNRSFDIAGPNPTVQEQRAIDEHYTSYLDQHRRSIIAAAFAEKQREQQQAALQAETAVAAPSVPKDIKPIVAAKPKPHLKRPECADPLACSWSKLSNGLSDIKKALFGPAPAKARRTREG